MALEILPFIAELWWGWSNIGRAASLLVACLGLIQGSYP